MHTFVPNSFSPYWCPRELAGDRVSYELVRQALLRVGAAGLGPAAGGVFAGFIVALLLAPASATLAAALPLFALRVGLLLRQV